MENAHPRILQHMCKKLGIETPELNKYVNDRNVIIDRLKIKYNTNRGAIKVAILSLMNGGSTIYKELCSKCLPKQIITDNWIEQFKKEMTNVHESLSVIYPDRFAIQKKKRIARKIMKTAQ